MELCWLTQGGFRFADHGKRLVADPYMSHIVEQKEGLTGLTEFPLSLAELRPDVLLCTHDHLDHCDPEAVPSIAAAYPDCLLAGSLNAYRHFLALGVAENRCRRLQVGVSVDLAGFSVLPVLARHSDKEAVGVVIGAGGKRVYLTGDTLFDEAILANPQLRHLDAILICINGKLGNMTWTEAARTVTALQPNLAVPMHYGRFAENTVDPQPFIAACRAAGISATELTPGKKFTL